MPRFVRVSGTWREVARRWTRVSGTWRVAAQSTKVSGTWRAVTPVLNLSGASAGEIYHFSISTGIAGIRINTDGTIDKREGSTYTQIDASTDWMKSNYRELAPGNYDVRAQLSSGDSLNAGSDSLNTWLAVSSGPYEWFNSDSSGFSQSSILVQIRLEQVVALTLTGGTYVVQSESS